MVDLTKKQQGANPIAPQPPNWPNFGGNIPQTGINNGSPPPSSITSNSSSTSSNGNSLGGSIGAINGSSTAASAGSNFTGILNSSGQAINGTVGSINGITPMINLLAPGLGLAKPVISVAYPRSGITTDIRYVIVQNDGTCVELAEDPMITPREMIGISKFIAVVNLIQQATLSNSKNSVEIYWSELVDSLNIDRHFASNGLTVSSYNTPDTLHIFLYDPQ